MDWLLLSVVLLAAVTLGGSALLRRPPVRGGATEPAGSGKALATRAKVEAAGTLLFADAAGLTPALPAERAAAIAWFDQDTGAEIAAAGSAWGAIATAVRSRFGELPERVPRERLGVDWRTRVDTGRLFAYVRLHRALDEQLRRLALPPSRKPADWDSFYAGGRAPVPAAPWEGQAQTHSAGDDDSVQGDASGQRRAAAQALAGALGRVASGLGLPPPLTAEKSAGSHRDYFVTPWPWGKPYLHMFAGEPVAGVDADLVLSHGIKGGRYGFTALLIEDGGAPPALEAERALRLVGYGVHRLQAAAVLADADAAAHTVLAGIAPGMMADMATADGIRPKAG